MGSVIIAGGGAAGMMAAIIAARNGQSVTLFEKNEKLGKKLFITGKGRCNFTNAGDSDDIFESVVTNQKFLYSAFHGFSNYDVMSFFDELGLKFKVERGNRVFPESDHSSDVIRVLQRQMEQLGVKIRLQTQITEVVVDNGVFSGVYVQHYMSQKDKNTVTQKQEFVKAESLIIATGGNSYQPTGSTGDGYRFARQIGHHVTAIYPALVPFIAKEEWVKELQGLSLKNVQVTISDGKNLIYSEFGEMLFTHYGVSGPAVLSASSHAAKVIQKHPLQLVIDLKPALSNEQLDERILRDFQQVNNKSFKNSLDKLLPKKMIPVVVDRSGISPEKKVNEITGIERHALVELLKNFDLTLTGLRGFQEAIITQGGVEVKEINPSTMESKMVSGVYFAGEVIDVDAVTGGFNLQIAWSTAYAAATHLPE